MHNLYEQFNQYCYYSTPKPSKEPTWWTPKYKPKSNYLPYKLQLATDVPPNQPTLNPPSKTDFASNQPTVSNNVPANIDLKSNPRPGLLPKPDTRTTKPT